MINLTEELIDVDLSIYDAFELTPIDDEGDRVDHIDDCHHMALFGHDEIDGGCECLYEFDPFLPLSHVVDCCCELEADLCKPVYDCYLGD